MSVGLGRVRINRTPSGLITRTVHRPGTVVDTTMVLNSRRLAVAGGAEDGPPETRRAAAERRRAAAADAEDGASRDLRSGCLGCGGLLLLVVLMIVGLASCLGGSGVLSFTDSPSPTMLPTAVSPSVGPGTSTASSGTGVSPTSSAVPPRDRVDVPSPSSLATTTSPTRPASPTSQPRPRSSRPAPSPSTSSAPTRHAPKPTAKPSTEPTRKPPRRPTPRPTRTVPRPTFCYPTTEYGGCYHVGDYCSEVYVGLDGVDAYGRRITCMPVNDFGIWM